LRKSNKIFAMLILIVAMVFSIASSAFASTWVQKADYPAEKDLFELVEANGHLYGFGGRDGAFTINYNTLYEYNPQANTWNQKANMPFSLSYSSSAVLNDKIYLIGGDSTAADGTKSVYEYDPVSEIWTPKAPLLTGRVGLASVTSNGKIYAMGGGDKLEEYDPTTNTWTSKADLLGGGTVYSPAAAVNGKIYVFGGYGGNIKIQEYDPNTNVWTYKNNIPGSISSYGQKAVTFNGKVYILGGNGEPKGFYEYDPVTEIWTKLPDMSQNRMYFGAAMLNGTIYATGGEYLGYFKSTEAYTLQSITNAPSNLSATAGNAQVTLNWSTVSGATGYNIKRSTTAGGPYTTVASNVYGSPYTDTTVTNGTKYYYVVTAISAGGESGNSNEASATPQGTVTPPTSGNRALLVITLTSGLEKEYDLPIADVNSFTAWYAARAAGTGAEVYTINKSFNKASFLSRKDNIAFDKIELYEVNEYTLAP
jgi:N-acetylneuraminic acid mutarotase